MVREQDVEKKKQIIRARDVLEGQKEKRLHSKTSFFSMTERGLESPFLIFFAVSRHNFIDDRVMHLSVTFNSFLKKGNAYRHPFASFE